MVNGPDSVPPSGDSAPKPPPMSAEEKQREQYNRLYGGESMGDFWANVAVGNKSDPGASQFFANLMNALSAQLNRNLKKSREALKEMKKSIQEQG